MFCVWRNGMFHSHEGQRPSPIAQVCVNIESFMEPNKRTMFNESMSANVYMYGGVS